MFILPELSNVSGTNENSTRRVIKFKKIKYTIISALNFLKNHDDKSNFTIIIKEEKYKKKRKLLLSKK